MSKESSAGKFLLAGGVAELVIAAIHFLMPLSIDRSARIAGVSAEYRSFISLATYAVGICMVAFGVLSIYFSRRTSQDGHTWWIFSLSQGSLWVVRVFLELILPIRIPLFFLSDPTVVILPAAIVIALLFMLPTFGNRKGFME